MLGLPPFPPSSSFCLSAFFPLLASLHFFFFLILSLSASFSCFLPNHVTFYLSSIHQSPLPVLSSSSLSLSFMYIWFLSWLLLLLFAIDLSHWSASFFCSLFFPHFLSEPPLTANLSGLLNVSLSVCFSTRSVISSKTTSQALIFPSQAYFFEFSLVFLHPFLHISIVLSLPVIGVEDKLPYGRERQEVWLKNDRPQFRTVSTFCRTNMRIQMHTKQTVLPWKSTRFYRWLNHVRL